MSSVENAPKSILKSAEPKAANKKNVRFDDTAERYSIRKSVQVLNFSRGLTASLPEYFSEKAIGDGRTLKAEVSADTEFGKKFSDNTDLCIVFSREDLPLSAFYPIIHADLKALRGHPNLKILEIEVKARSDFSYYIEKTIAAVKGIYTQEDENPEITQLKEEFADKASTILKHEEPVSLERAKKGPSRGVDLMKRVAFRDLVRLYVAINNTNPEIIVGEYQAYQEKLVGLDNKFLERREQLDLFYEDFPCLDRKLEPNGQYFYLDRANYNQYLSTFEDTLNKGREEAWKQLCAKVIQHYPKQLPQQANVVVAEDSDMVDVIAADSDMVDAIAAGPDPAVVTTVVGVPSNTMTGSDAMKDVGEEPKKISVTPFWSIQPAQPVVENTEAQTRTGLTI